ncbi:exodeoxyribonuclease VII large subunit, partial [Candidatus Curtissbacteria bacterium RBG_13_35_7]
MKIIDGRSVYTITEINNLARESLEKINVWVEGELSAFRGYNTRYRYLYFDLKDPQSQYKLPCVLDPQIYDFTKDDLEDGMKLLALGTLSLWEKEGRYQMYVMRIEMFGQGILLENLEKLKKKLQQKGYFNQEAKKKLPDYPRTIAVVTSKDSDAWQDFKKHSINYFKFINCQLFDVLVQGQKSVLQIIETLKKVDKMNYEVIVLIRGGGSIEDLSGYNDEKLADQIYKAKTPILTGIGHEKDITIADLVADFRASTPTDAAKIIINNYLNLQEKLIHIKLLLSKLILNIISLNFQQIDSFLQHLLKQKEKYIYLKQNFGYLKKALTNGILNVISTNEAYIAKLLDKLNLLTPQK